jgi:hypothetical protein
MELNQLDETCVWLVLIDFKTVIFDATTTALGLQAALGGFLGILGLPRGGSSGILTKMHMLRGRATQLFTHTDHTMTHFMIGDLIHSSHLSVFVVEDIHRR